MDTLKEFDRAGKSIQKTLTDLKKPSIAAKGKSVSTTTQTLYSKNQ